MIHAPGLGNEAATGAPARMIAALRARGLEIHDSPEPARDGPVTLLISTPVDWMRLGVRFAPWLVRRGARVVVLSRIGAHPDARAPGLRDLWRLEEYARVSLVPTLVLRFGPLVARESPFWMRLRSRPRLGPEGRHPVMPVLEEDAVTALERALREERPGEGWFEVVGPEARSLAEWAEIAAPSGPGAPEGAGGWEPPVEELTEHRLSEPEPWQERFAIPAQRVTAWARAS